MGKHRKSAAVVMVLLGVFMVFAVFFIHNRGKTEEAAEATGKTALEAFRDIAGESRVESLATGLAKGSKDPAGRLAEQSVFVIDKDAVGAYLESCMTGAESTAHAAGITCDELIMDEWGYDSVEAYRAHMEAEVTKFIKQRLAIYAAAEEKGMRITGREYKKRLPQYARRFGYEDTAGFEAACLPASIANEMLYDKVVDSMKGRGE